jgi:predicted TIM-barrel fold metal-dependent hydrolase
MHPVSFGAQAVYQHFRETGEIPPEALAPFWDAVRPARRAVALALWAPQSGIEISNEFIAAVVRQDPARLVGFASVDPMADDAISRLEFAVDHLGMRGVKLSPIYQHFAADDPRLWPLYARIQERRLPIMWHQGATFLATTGPFEEARPGRLDKIAAAFPEIPMVIAHFGYPWSDDTVALLRKHRNLYADVSVLARRPWFLYNALIAALEYGAGDKILLGSDFPAGTVAEMAEALRRVNDVARGTGMPTVPPAVIEAIIERDSLALLGID